MRYCPTCGASYAERSVGTCPKDGSVLVSAERMRTLQHDPLIGHTLAGRYVIQSRLGIGGMGTVYRAEQTGLRRSVALKVLRADLITDRDTVARFQREAKAMSLLMHSNTVRVFDFGEDPEGHLFLAMELLEGELLTSKLDRQGPLDVAEAIGVTQQILRSLAEAHGKGLIHRDLKPDNIYLARVVGQGQPVVKVLDFGIAKIFRDEAKIDQLETQAGTVFGTPRYMSPEQAQGKKLDQRSDLYAVGVLLYQLLAGRAPFIDDDAVVVMAKHIREQIRSVRDVAVERPIPPSLEAVVKRALEKTPDKRFTTAEEFEAALIACVPDIEREVVARKKKPFVPEAPKKESAVTTTKVPPRRDARAARSEPARRGLFSSSAVRTGIVAAVGVLAIAIFAVVRLRASGQTRVVALDPTSIPDAVEAVHIDVERPRTRELRIESTPSDIHVTRLDGSEVGITPFRLTVPEGDALELVFTSAAYVTQTANVRDAINGALHVILTPSRPPEEQLAPVTTPRRDPRRPPGTTRPPGTRPPTTPSTGRPGGYGSLDGP